jgi:hypothetical protein
LEFVWVETMDQVIQYVLRPAATDEDPAVPVASTPNGASDQPSEDGDPIGENGSMHDTPSVQTAATQQTKPATRRGTQESKKKRAAKTKS